MLRKNLKKTVSSIPAESLDEIELARQDLILAGLEHLRRQKPGPNQKESAPAKNTKTAPQNNPPSDQARTQLDLPQEFKRERTKHQDCPFVARVMRQIVTTDIETHLSDRSE